MGQCKDDAMFSRDGRYRYLLTRRIDGGRGAVMFVMLNPSKANEVQNDNTISKCIKLVENWGLGVLHVVNLSPVMATRPANMLASLPEPMSVQRRNFRFILKTASRSDCIVVAYGNDASKLKMPNSSRSRAEVVTQALRDNGYKLFCLKVNKGGHPKHPLYVKKSTHPIAYPVPRSKARTRRKSRQKGP